MKKTVFFTLFIVTHIGFFFLQINKQMQQVKESFNKQKNERLIASLEQKEQELTNQLYALQSKSAIKEFAQQDLQLKPVKITQVKPLSQDE